jgi:hypothetical protein
MLVSCAGNGRIAPKGESMFKVVPIDFIRKIGDCDIDAVIDEARSFPGREIRMPSVQRSINMRGGLRYAS